MMRIVYILFMMVSVCAADTMQLSGGSVVLSGGVAPTSLSKDRQLGILELFIDESNVYSISGVSRTVNKPAKYGSSAIFGDDATDTWDDDKRTTGVFKYGDGDWRMWYQGNPDEFHATNQVSYQCYAVSTNGIAWTRPIVGLTSYDGSTSNNIVSPAGGGADDTGQIMSTNVAGSFGAISFGSFQWSSTSGTNWTKGADLTPTGQTNLTWGTSDFFQMRDGTWRTYSQLYLDSKRQGGIAFGGSTYTDTYTPRALPMPGAEAASTSDQKYFWRVKYHGGNWIGFAWDSKGIYGGKRLIREGDDWYYYYDGGDVLHNASENFNVQIGLATIGYERIGQIGTTGTVVMRPITPTGGLLINTDASGGTLKVALFNPNTGVVNTGYDYTDFDTISSDTYSTAGTWGGLAIPQGTPVRVGFTLSNATVYAYSAGVPVSQVIE